MWTQAFVRDKPDSSKNIDKYRHAPSKTHDKVLSYCRLFILAKNISKNYAFINMIYCRLSRFTKEIYSGIIIKLKI
jgi:hypothetical protein